MSTWVYILIVNERILQPICVGMYHIVFYFPILDPVKEPPISGSVRSGFGLFSQDILIPQKVLAQKNYMR